MLYSVSRPYHIPTSTAIPQYDITNGYLSTSYNKWLQSTPESDFYVSQNDGSTTNSSSRPYQSHRPRDNYLNESFSDISKAQYARPRQDQPVTSTVNSKRPIINYLLP